MAKLNATARKSLPKSSFGLPGGRKYPMPDKSHAADAKGRAKQMLSRGRLSQRQYDNVVSKANRKLHSG